MIELYYYENSVCSERALMTLAEKGIEDWKARHIDLFKGEQANPEYMILNPKAQVPTLLHDGNIVRESSIVCDYLDDLKGSSPLKPVGFPERARMREWIKDADEAGFTGIGSLSFVAVFREKLNQMTEVEREILWDEQTDLARTYRQKSCFNEGLKSPHAQIALAAWASIFNKLEAELSDGRMWIMGVQFTLADLNYAPLIARLEAIQFLPIWLDDKPNTKLWWARLKERPSYKKANVGPDSGDEQETFAREGAKIVEEARKLLKKLS